MPAALSEDFCYVVPFAVVDADQNPNAKNSSSDGYFRATIVCFASIRRFDQSARLLLLVTEMPNPQFTKPFDDLRVEVRVIDFAHKPPEGFSRTFSGSLFLLDALYQLSATVNIIVDPDVVFLRDPTRELSRLDGIGVLPLAYSEEKLVNGLKVSQLRELHQRENPTSKFQYFGGEFYVIPGKLTESVQKNMERAWILSLQKYGAGEAHYKTEEHILSSVISAMPNKSVATIVRRIWTAHSYRNVGRSDSRLMAWHLPAEKGRGFDELYADGRWREFQDLSDAEFLKMAGKAMGLTGRSARRRFLDALGPINRLRRVVDLVLIGRGRDA